MEKMLIIEVTKLFMFFQYIKKRTFSKPHFLCKFLLLTFFMQIFIINDHDGLLKHFYYKLQQRFGVYSEFLCICNLMME